VTDCVTQPNGLVCPPASDWATCRPWDLTTQDRANCYIDSLNEEALQIAGAQINVHKLLGVHEQTKLVDLIGDGKAISGGNAPGYPAVNAFTTLANEWRSLQTGAAATLASTYIGYDFGVVKIPNGRQRYGIDAPVRQHITTIKIKQSADPLRRVAKVRIERSENGAEWYGVAVVTLPNDDQLNTVHFKHSVPSRYWRLRPIGFVGTACDSWGVQALEMYDYSATHISNIEDKILMENRNRDYMEAPVLLKGYYDIVAPMMDLSRFGAEWQDTYTVKVNFNSCVAKLGRLIVVGDILELPSETMYTPDLRPIKRFLEVTDVTWDPGSFTPGWHPLNLQITAKQALASQETQDIFGDLAKNVDSSGLFDKDDGNNQMYQDFSAVDQTIKADAATQVPERGSEGSNTIREFEPEEIATAAAQGFPHLSRLGFNRRGVYVEDAIPQNGAPYTEGPDFPTNPAEGAYHRLTYQGLAKDVPARLYRWSTTKNRWIYLETDRRAEFNDQQPKLTEYTTSAHRVWAREVK
jgi:hypothetical protein